MFSLLKKYNFNKFNLQEVPILSSITGNKRQFSTSIALSIDENNSGETKQESLKEALAKLDKLEEKLFQIGGLVSANRADKKLIEEAKGLSDYVEQCNLSLEHYVNDQIIMLPWNAQKVILERMDIVKRECAGFFEEAMALYENPNKGDYPDRESLHIINKLNGKMRTYLIFCKNELYGTPDRPSENVSIFRYVHKGMFEDLELTRDDSFHKVQLAYISEDSKRRRFLQAQSDYDEKLKEYNVIKDEVIDLKGEKISKVRFADSNEIIPYSSPLDVIKQWAFGSGKKPPEDTPKSSVDTLKPSIATSSADASTTPPETSKLIPRDIGKISDTDLPESSSDIKGKGKSKETVSDYVNTSLEPFDFMDPD